MNVHIIRVHAQIFLVGVRNKKLGRGGGGGLESFPKQETFEWLFKGHR